MSRSLRMIALYSTIVIVLSVSAFGTDSPDELIAEADLAYMTRYVQEDMMNAIALYEAVLPDLDTLSEGTQAYVLNRLAQLCYEAAMFTEGNTAEDKELFTKGKEYGFQSLRLNEEFAAHEPDGLEEALPYVTDPAALHWTANNWGMLCGLDPIQGLLEQGSVLALFRRCIEIDPDFWGGSAKSALGALLIMVPGWLGGDDEAGLKLINESILSDPTYLYNHIILAKYWGFTYNTFGKLTGVRDAELIERETEIVRQGEIGDWPCWNREAKLEADRLLARLQDMRE